VRACLDRARELGLTRVVMSTQAGMVHAHRIYERLGFIRTPERDWSPVPGIDLMTYAVELTTESDPARHNM
jgi:ribosomal protein S18 acetylase RimI-like enzyme